GGRQPGKVADEAQADVVLQQLPHLPLQGQRQQAEKLLHFLGRALPVLAGKGEQGEMPHAALAGGADQGFRRLLAGLVAERARPPALLRPAAIAIHDDGDVTRQCGGIGHVQAQISSSSCSFAASRRSISATYLSVSFCTSSCARRSSSSEISFSFSSALRSPSTSRRMLRTATRAFSASWRTTLMRSRRRSSVSGGSGTRMVCPAVAGLRPRSEVMIAFSITPTICRSQGCTASVRESSTEMLATWLRGTSEP